VRTPADRFLQAEGVDERERVASHGGDVLRDDSRGTANTAVVEEDDLSILRQAVDERRVPVVEVSPEVLEHHQRRGGRLLIAEAAVDERHLSDLEREVLGRQLSCTVETRRSLDNASGVLMASSLERARLSGVGAKALQRRRNRPRRPGR
jgi:hypothetical protein